MDGITMTPESPSVPDRPCTHTRNCFTTSRAQHPRSRTGSVINLILPCAAGKNTTPTAAAAAKTVHRTPRKFRFISNTPKEEMSPRPANGAVSAP